MTTSHGTRIGLILLCVVACPLHAQPNRTPRETNETFWVAPHGPRVRVTSRPGDPAYIVKYVDESWIATTSTITAPFDLEGGVFWLRDPVSDLDELLLAGTATAASQIRGILSVARRHPITDVFQLAESFPFPTSDLLGVVYCDVTHRLLLLDDTQQVIWQAPYTPGGTLPQGWTAYANYSRFTGKRSLARYTLYVAIDEPVPTYIIGEFRDRDETHFKDIYVLREEPSGVAFETIPGGGDHRQAWVHESEYGILDGDTQLLVSAPAAAQYAHIAPSNAVTIRDIDSGSVVGSALLDPFGSTTVAVAPLQMGTVYGLSTTLFRDDSDRFVPTRSFGIVDSLPDGWTLEPIASGYGLSSYVGCDTFLIGLDLKKGPSSGFMPACPILLLVGVESQVIEYGQGKAFLDTAIQFPSQVINTQNSAYGMEYLPIPDDPLLAGGVVCYQWLVMLTPDDIRTTNVRAMMVRATDPLEGTFNTTGAVTSLRAGVLGPQGDGNRETSWNETSLQSLHTWAVRSGARFVSNQERQSLRRRVTRR